MSEIINIENLVATKIIEIRGYKVIIDSDVAELYNVETKRINEAVKNNPEKFPKEYIIGLTDKDKSEVVEIFDHLKNLKFSPVLPKAFTEKGLYMLATILKSSIATQTTLAIIDTFAKVRELRQTISTLQNTLENPAKQKHLMQKTGELMSDLIFSDDNLEVTESETTLVLGFPFVKLKKVIKKKAS